MEASNRNSTTKSVAIFLGLAIVFAALVLVSRGMSDPFAQQVMLSAGSATLGSALTFFLIKTFGSRG